MILLITKVSYISTCTTINISLENGNTPCADIAQWEIYSHVGISCSHCSAQSLPQGNGHKSLEDHRRQEQEGPDRSSHPHALVVSQLITRFAWSGTEPT